MARLGRSFPVRPLIARQLTRPGFASLTDDFSTKNLAVWNLFGVSDITGGQLTLTPHSTYADGADTSPAGLRDLRGSSVTFQLVQPLNLGNGTTESFFAVRVDASNAVMFYVSGSTLGFRETVGGVNSDTTTTFSSSTHKWFRLDHTNTGSLLWQTSPDGLSWTTQRTKAPGAAWVGAIFEVIVGFFGTEPTPGILLVDNLNLPPTGASITLGDTGAAADTLTVAATAGLADSAGAADALTVSAAASLPDTGSAADVLTVPSRTLALADTASAVDALTAAAAAPLADAGSAAETLTAAVTVALADAGSATDAVDNGLGTNKALSDGGAATEVLTVTAASALADSGSAGQTFTAGAAVSLADVAAAADALAVPARTIPLADTAAAAEAMTASAALALADSGSAADSATGSNTTNVTKSLADSGSASERLRITIRRPNTGTTARPAAGMTARPNSGITYRP